MTDPKNTRIFEMFWHQVTSGVRRIDEWTHGWVGVLTSATKDTLKPESAITAASIAYFSLFSLFPLIILSIFIASFNLIPQMDQQLIVNRIEFFIPALGQLLGPNIDQIIETRGSVTSIALIGLIWSSSTIFYMLTQTLYSIWGYKRRRAFWKRRGLAILFVLTIVGPALVLASFASSMITNLRSILPEQISKLGSGINLIVAILIDIGLFMLLYFLLPHGVSTWREILPGAIGAGLLWELAKNTFLLFVSTYLTASNLIYGPVATIIAFLTWAYLSGLIFLFGAYLSLAYVRLKQRRREETG
jgi:membrane protein